MENWIQNVYTCKMHLVYQAGQQELLGGTYLVGLSRSPGSGLLDGNFFLSSFLIFDTSSRADTWALSMISLLCATGTSFE